MVDRNNLLEQLNKLPDRQWQELLLRLDVDRAHLRTAVTKHQHNIDLIRLFDEEDGLQRLQKALRDLSFFKEFIPPLPERKKYILDLLNRLIPSQFDTVIFYYDVDVAHLSNGTQNQRAIELIRYAIQKEGADLAQLLQVIYKVAPHLEER